MEDAIIKLIRLAEDTKNLDIIVEIKTILEEFYFTSRIPEEWKNLGEKIADLFDEKSWVWEQLELDWYVCIPFC